MFSLWAHLYVNSRMLGLLRWLLSLLFPLWAHLYVNSRMLLSPFIEYFLSVRGQATTDDIWEDGEEEEELESTGMGNSQRKVRQTVVWLSGFMHTKACFNLKESLATHV